MSDVEAMTRKETYFNEEPNVMRWETISKHALDEQLDNFQVRENLERL